MMDHPLKAFRAKRGLSQHALAQLVGVGESTVTRWEKSVRTPRGKDLRRLVEVTGIPVAELLGMMESSTEAHMTKMWVSLTLSKRQAEKVLAALAGPSVADRNLAKIYEELKRLLYKH